MVSPTSSLVAVPPFVSAGWKVIVPLYPALQRGDPTPGGAMLAAAGPPMAVAARGAAPAAHSSSLVVRRRRLCLITAAVAYTFTAGSFPLAGAKPGPRASA